MRRVSPLRQRPNVFLGTPQQLAIFLLLACFAYAAAKTTPERELIINAAHYFDSARFAAAEPLPAAAFDNVVVRIIHRDGAAAWLVNDQSLPDLPAVGKQLAALAQVKADAPVILHPDPAAPLGDVIDVFDLAHRAGFETIQFAASAE